MSSEAIKLFENPNEKYNDTRDQLNKYFQKEVAEEIDAFIHLETQEMYNRILKMIIPRYKKLRAEVYEKDAKTKEDHTQKIKRFFELTNVQDVSKEIKEFAEFKELETGYTQLLEKLSANEYGHLFKQFQFDEKVFQFLKSGLLYDLHKVTTALSQYSKEVSRHFQLLRDRKYRSGERTFLKIGASLFGGLSL